MSSISSILTHTTRLTIDDSEPPMAYKALREATLKKRKSCLPSVTPKKTLLCLLAQEDSTTCSQRSTAEGSIDVTKRNSIEIISDMEYNTESIRQRGSKSTPKNPNRKHRVLRKSEVDKPNISDYLSNLRVTSQAKIKEFEQKFMELNEMAQEFQRRKREEEEEKLNQDPAEQFRQAHLPKKAKATFTKEHETVMDSVEMIQSLKGSTDTFSRRPASLYTRKKTLKPIVISFLQSLPKTQEAVEMVKEFVSQRNTELNQQAKSLAEETVRNYEMFKEKAWKNKTLRLRIRRIMEEEKILETFNHKEDKHLPLEIRIYMDMIEYRKLDELVNDVSSCRIASALKKSEVNLDSLCAPTLLEKRYHKYRRLNEELKDANVQNRVEEIENLQNELINAHKDFATRKEQLLRRLAKTDRKKLLETKAQCDQFESLIPIYEPDGILSKIERYELTRGDFDGVRDETRLMNQKLNDLLKNWNHHVEDYGR